MRHHLVPRALTRAPAAMAVLVVLATACVPGDDGSPVTAPGDDGSPVTVPDPGGGDVAATPVLVTLSIHVEGWRFEATDEAMFDTHVGYLREIADAASAHGAVVTFELSPEFVDGVVAWNSAILDELTAMGHGIAIHADVGGSGEPTFEQMVLQLRSQVDGLAAAGYSTQHVSGVCSRGPWVEAAAAAGFTSIGGGVEYCLTSLDAAYMPAGYEWIYDCASPAVCHGHVPVPTEQAMHPWWATSSADWIVPKGTGDVLVISGGGEADISCFTRDGTGACPEAAADMASLSAAIDQYVALHAGDDQVAVLPLTWSVGRPPADGLADTLFATVQPYQDTAQVEWVSVTEAADRMGG